MLPACSSALDDRPESSIELDRNLRVVLLETLERQLASESDAAVLATLANGDTLLSDVRTMNVRSALVSYRQEKCALQKCGSGGDEFAAFTLDGAALRGIVAAARSLGVDAVWLDAWCYRSPAGKYEHEDFCKTLQDVVEGVEAVVWLPRSKHGSAGDYAYRLWARAQTRTPSLASASLPSLIALACGHALRLERRPSHQPHSRPCRDRPARSARSRWRACSSAACWSRSPEMA